MGRLTLDEKISLLNGSNFAILPVPRLGVPAVRFADASQGVRGGEEGTHGPATAFPSGVAMAATWNQALIGRVGEAIGVESKNKGIGVHVLLGPAVNIQRSPLGGRNGEYFSEDPFLSARLGVSYINGIQSTGTLACIKHFAANNEESDRMSVNVQVSERALREIYLPAFEAGVKEGKVATVMSSYNRLNGPHASANRYLLTDILKRGWGFDGMVMSDWGGVHSVASTINAGNDLEMPGPGLMTPDNVKKALERGQVTQQQIDENVTRIVRTILRSGVLNEPYKPDQALVNSQAHRQVALQAALEGLTLLKNEGQILPLDSRKLRSIALIGPGATQMQIGAAGSPIVEPVHSVGPVEGITARAGRRVTVRSTSAEVKAIPFAAGTIMAPSGEPGFKAEYFPNRDLKGDPILTRTEAQLDFNAAPPQVGPENWSARFTTTFTPPVGGPVTFYFRSDDGCRLFLDGKAIIDEWRDSAPNAHPGPVILEAGRKYELRAEYYQGGGGAMGQLYWAQTGGKLFSEAAALAARSDVAVVFVTTRGTEAEGGDRPSMSLPDNQDQLIREVIAANKKTIVVLNNGTPVAMPWVKDVPAILEAWFPGQEGGRALAQILFGDVSPSGHLPTTLAVRREDYPDYGNFPGTNGVAKYAEGIYVGYRAFDKKRIEPLFPFGHGLSYTTFRIDQLKLSAPTLRADGTVTAKVRVSNTGLRPGAEVVQLYVHDPNPKVDKAVRELKGFVKVMLQPGEIRTVSMMLKPRDFAWCDVKGGGWRVNAGNYEIAVGDSSRSLKQRATLRVAASFEPIPYMVDQATRKAAIDKSDLARGKKVTATTVQEAQYKAKFAVDGDQSSRWSSSFADDQWLTVDLGKKQKVGSVELHWENAFAVSYRIEVSDDNQHWTTAFSTDKGTGGEDAVSFPAVNTRYVRLYCVKRATEFGNSVYSFQVRAPK